MLDPYFAMFPFNLTTMSAFSARLACACLCAATVGASWAEASPTYEYRQRAKGLQVQGAVVPGEAPAAPESSPLSLTQFVGYRAWSDGSLAPSCLAYRQPGSGRAYQGATGDGTYRVQTTLGPVDVFCDMTLEGGGWTLVMRGNPSSMPQDWAVWTTRDGVEAHSLAQLEGTTAKWPDVLINEWSQQAFRAQGSVNGQAVGTRYFSAGCELDMSALPTGDCAVSFSDVQLSSGQRVRYDPEDRGANHRGMGDYRVYTLRPDPLVRSLTFTLGLPNAHLWFIGTGSPDEFESALGSTATTTLEGPAAFKLFVR